MKAIRIHQYGGPEVVQFEDIPTPSPVAGEVLVRVQTVGVNPIDWMIPNGFGKDWLQHTLPLTLSWEVAGIVEAVGADVDSVQPGDAIYAFPSLHRNGVAAEYAVIPAAEVALKPASLDFAQAAAIPVGTLTSWQAFDLAGLTAGQTVLIHAAAGGVGSMAVQVAKARGARVIGTASKRNHGFLREIGADDVIDYTTQRFEDVVQNVDVVFDLIGGETLDRSWQTLKRDGFLVSAVQPPDESVAQQHGVGAAMVSVAPNGAQLREITALVEAGKIKPFVEYIFPLAQFADAYAQSATGRTRGKIVLQAA